MNLQDKTYIIDEIYQNKQQIKQQKLLVQIVITLQLFSILLITVDVLL
jgi:hypothetical protein